MIGNVYNGEGIRELVWDLQEYLNMDYVIGLIALPVILVIRIGEALVDWMDGV